MNIDEIMGKLLKWYKENHYDQGDSYHISYSPGISMWTISHSNDYPLQHGPGGRIRLRTDQVDKIINQDEKS